MGNLTFLAPLVQDIADGTAVANSTTETTIHTAAYTMPANFLHQTKGLQIFAFGKHSTTATPTLTFKLRAGGTAGTTLATTAAITTGSGVTNIPYMIHLMLTARSPGSAGTVMCNGYAQVGSASTVFNFMTAGGASAPATASFSMVAAQDLVLTATWSAASASNTLTNNNFYIFAID